jgi:hypothetical protein
MSLSSKELMDLRDDSIDSSGDFADQFGRAQLGKENHKYNQFQGVSMMVRKEASGILVDLIKINPLIIAYLLIITQF